MYFIFPPMRELIDPTNDTAVFPAQGQGKGVPKNNTAWNMKNLDRIEWEEEHAATEDR